MKYRYMSNPFIMACFFPSLQRTMKPAFFVHSFVTTKTAFRATNVWYSRVNKVQLHGHGKLQELKYSTLRQAISSSGGSNLFLSNTETEDINVSIQTLAEKLGAAFLEGGTDGIMQVAPYVIGRFSGEEIISCALEASKNNKGQAAGILNALIASCGELENQSSNAFALAWEIYSIWEEIAEEIELYPDMVSFCCTHSTMIRASEVDADDTDFFQVCASQVLERAERYSKKLAGTKRRKILNTIARKGGRAENVKAANCISQLQKNYGHDFGILHEDDNVLVINKPSGMVCFHSRKTTDGKIGRKKKKQKGSSEEVRSDISLEDALIDVGLSLSTLNPDALGLVHRIDRGTSGCIILAKNNAAHAKLVTQFFTRRAKKRYIAVVPNQASDGSTDLEDAGVINEKVEGRPAQSAYQVEREIGTSALLIGVETKTGRKHQVRIHCSFGLGRPIFLDPLYSNSQGNKKQPREKVKKSDSTSINPMSKDCVQCVLDKIVDEDGRRFFLHASDLKIDEFGIDLTAPLPSWWEPVLKELEQC